MSTIDSITIDHAIALLQEIEKAPEGIFPRRLSPSERTEGAKLLSSFFDYCTALSTGEPPSDSIRESIEHKSRGFFTSMMLYVMQQLWPMVPEEEQVPEEQRKIAITWFQEFEKMYRYLYVFQRLESVKTTANGKPGLKL